MPNVAIEGWIIIDNGCLPKSPWAQVTFDDVNPTVCAWKITHWKPYTPVKLKPCMCTSSESIHMLILFDIATHNHRRSHNVLRKMYNFVLGHIHSHLWLYVAHGLQLDMPVLGRNFGFTISLVSMMLALGFFQVPFIRLWKIRLLPNVLSFFKLQMSFGFCQMFFLNLLRWSHGFSSFY